MPAVRSFEIKAGEAKLARAELNAGHEYWEIGQAIVAAWFKALGEKRAIKKLDADQIKAALSDVIKTKISEVIPDPENQKEIFLVIPQPPVKTPEQLLKYLKEFDEKTDRGLFLEELGKAVIFGCGKR
jgi:hypothetical protein